jgi:hypothetical protein
MSGLARRSGQQARIVIGHINRGPPPMRRRCAPGTPRSADSLPELDHYLHDRTAGMIGSLSHLIRGAAVDAILTGTEAVTKTVLDRVELDHAADSQHATKRRR